RRPLLQLVVIYASNQKVMDYGNRVANTFINSGVDVFLQTTPDGIRTKDIMSRHMAEIILLSHTDFLIVIGDRNFTNHTIQSKRKGKLIEMTIPDMQILIWKSWPCNPVKNHARIQELNTEQIEDLLFQYTG